MSAKYGSWGFPLDKPVLGGAWQNNKGDTMNKDPNRGTERFRSFDEFMDFAYYEAREIHALAWATNWALYNPDHRLDQDELITRAKQLIHASEIKAEALFKLLGNWEDLQRAAASSGERS